MRARAPNLTSAAALLTIVTGVSVGLAGPAIAAKSDCDAHDWPIFGFDYSNSVNDCAETKLDPANVSGLTERWRVDGIAAVTGTPAIVDGVVYFGDWAGRVFAIDARDGSSVWEAQPSDAQITASVAVGGDVVITADLHGWVRALDRASGDVGWATALDPLDASAFSSPVIIEDTVVIGDSGPGLGWEGRPGFHASVVALDIADGSERWRLRTDAGTDDPDTWVPIWSSAGYDPTLGLVYFGTGNTDTLVDGQAGALAFSTLDDPNANAIMAIDETSGELAWVTRLVPYDVGRDVDVGAAPNLFSVDGRAVVGAGSKDGDYAVLDRETGELLWQVDLTAGSAAGGVMSTAAVDEDTIYVASNAGLLSDGTIFALDASDGTIRWQRSYAAPTMGGSMALANDVLFRGFLDGSLVAMAASDGTELWTAELEGRVNSGVSISDGMVYVGYGSGEPSEFLPVDGGVVAYGLP